MHLLLSAYPVRGSHSESCSSIGPCPACLLPRHQSPSYPPKCLRIASFRPSSSPSNLMVEHSSSHITRFFSPRVSKLPRPSFPHFFTQSPQPRRSFDALIPALVQFVGAQCKLEHLHLAISNCSTCLLVSGLHAITQGRSHRGPIHSPTRAWILRSHRTPVKDTKWNSFNRYVVVKTTMMVIFCWWWWCWW